MCYPVEWYRVDLEVWDSVQIRLDHRTEGLIDEEVRFLVRGRVGNRVWDLVAECIMDLLEEEE